MRNNRTRAPQRAQRCAQIRPAVVDPLQRYSVDEACALLRTGRAGLYLRIRAGEIRTITEGKRRYVPGTEIVRLSSLPGGVAR